MKSFPIYLAGEFISTSTPLEVQNPYSGEVFATTFLAGQAELEKAITHAQEAQEQMRQLPTHTRAEVLNHISKRLTEDRESLALLLAQESGKPMLYALGEIDRAAQTFAVAAEETKRLPGEVLSLDWTPAGNHKQGFVKYFPVGLVAAISPFNFPLNLAVHKIAPAIAAGCPIILKPASATPLSTLALAAIISETTLPKGAVSILPMDRATGNQLVTDERFALLSFTGSPEVGWEMKNNAGKKKVVLELGGNAGVIVTESANIEHAVDRCLAGAFAYSGQVCVHVQRIYVQQKHYQEFIQKLATKTQALKAGDPTDNTTQVSAMIDEKNAKRIEQWVEEAVSNGAQVVTGGDRQGSYYSPTILTNTQATDKVCAEEAFGPLVIIEPYDTFAEALAHINNSKFGLQAGVFTNSIQEQYQAWEQLHVGGVIINDIPSFRVDHMPYGGIKESGLGREGVKYAIQDMLEARLLAVHHEG